ncbi:MAG TPA: MlaD family protein [Myxococcota bacterium]|nr:MlaD family protein [Myxococcota bacterium]
MKQANRNYIAVGIFVLSMLAGLLFWIAVLSGVTGSTDRYYILWDKVMGLKPGTQILFEGYQIGLIERIERIEHDESSGADADATDGGADGGATGNGAAGDARRNYRVEIAVEKGWPIPDSAVAETTAPSFLAALVVNIDAGDSKRYLEPGSVIRSREPDDLLGAAGDVMASLTTLLEFVKPRIESITASVNSVLNDENAQRLSAMLQTLNERIADLLSAENAERVEVILTNMTSVSRDVSEMTAGLKLTKAQIDDILDQLSVLVDDHQDELGHSIEDLHASLEAVSRHIDAISSNLDDAARNANEFSEQIRRDPSLLLRGREPVDDGAR